MSTMIRVVPAATGPNYSMDPEHMEAMSVDTIGDSTATSGSFFSKNLDFNSQEQQILTNMIKDKKAKKKSSRTRRRASKGIELRVGKGDVMLNTSDHGTGESKFCESVATAITELDSPYLMSDTQSVASLQPQDLGGSRTLTNIKPLTRRLSREEQESFAFGESTGDFSEDDSFGSIEEANFADYSVASSMGMGNKQMSSNVKRSAQYDRASSRRSLQSVEEGAELPSPRVPLSPRQKPNALGSMLSKQLEEPAYNSGDEASAEMSIDPMAVFDKNGKRAARKKNPKYDFGHSVASSITMDTMIKPPPPAPGDVSPNSIPEKKKRKKKKKDKKKREKEKKANAIASAIVAQSPNTVFMESADDILKRWNTKIEELEDEAASMAPEDEAPKKKAKKKKAPRLRDASLDDMNLSAGRFLHDASTGDFGLSISDPSKRRMARNMSMSNLSASPVNSSLSGDEQEHKYQPRRTSSAVRRRPSLTTLFEWNREPSSSNLSAAASAADPPMEDESHLVMNVSTVPDRRTRLRRSLSTTDVSHYNKTTSWPPARRGSASHRGGMHNLHAQFYRRSTNLPTPAQMNSRSTESSPVITSEQMLQVMEPVTMREVLEFKGLSKNNRRDEGKRQKKLVNYGDILDSQSVSSSIAGGSARRL